MTDYECPSCGGGFPAVDAGDNCPWCGESMDGDAPSAGPFEPERSRLFDTVPKSLLPGADRTIGDSNGAGSFDGIGRLGRANRRVENGE